MTMFNNPPALIFRKFKQYICTKCGLTSVTDFCGTRWWRGWTLWERVEMTNLSPVQLHTTKYDDVSIAITILCRLRSYQWVAGVYKPVRDVATTDQQILR